MTGTKPNAAVAVAVAAATTAAAHEYYEYPGSILHDKEVDRAFGALFKSVPPARRAGQQKAAKQQKQKQQIC